jgi:tRNA pseudouridine synthase 10
MPGRGAVERPEEAFRLDEEVLGPARRALPLGLCKPCFGRLFGRRGRGLTNETRADLALHQLDAPLDSADPCPLCRGLFTQLDRWADRAIKASVGWEFDRFSCGSRWDPEILAREETLWSELGCPEGESARSAFNRETRSSCSWPTSSWD